MRKIKINKTILKEIGIEHILNYTTQRWQLTRPSKVGAVMELIRKCQPKNFETWVKYYWENAQTKSKPSIKINKKIHNELANKLFKKIQIVKKEFLSAFDKINLEICKDYISNVTLNRTYNGYNLEKFVIYKNLVDIFPKIKFEESDSNLDQSGDIDFIGKVENKNMTIGIQIKPITTQNNFGNYNIEDRMKKNFKKFEKKYKGKVYIIYSTNKEIVNKKIINIIKKDTKS